MDFVANSSRSQRDTSVPIWGDVFNWWTQAVRRAIDQGGIKQNVLAAELGIDEGALSRAIRRVAPIWEIVRAVSLRLRVPLPVVLLETEAAAIHVEEQHRMFRLAALSHELEQTAESVSHDTAIPRSPRKSRVRHG